MLIFADNPVFGIGHDLVTEYFRLILPRQVGINQGLRGFSFRQLSEDSQNMDLFPLCQATAAAGRGIDRIVEL